MHTEIRIFTGMAGQGGRFAARRAALESVLRQVPGLLGFQLVETAEGVTTIVTSTTAESAVECASAMHAWVAGQLPDLAERDALIVHGDVIASVTP
jgi:heme-degrading monooxygenase HmoA